jgi:hypothetical protein
VVVCHEAINRVRYAVIKGVRYGMPRHHRSSARSYIYSDILPSIEEPGSPSMYRLYIYIYIYARLSPESRIIDFPLLLLDQESYILRGTGVGAHHSFRARYTYQAIHFIYPLPVVSSELNCIQPGRYNRMRSVQSRISSFCWRSQAIVLCGGNLVCFTA